MIWNEKIAEKITHELLEKLAIESKDIELIRFGENGVFKSSDNSIVIRVCRPTKTKKEVMDEISICNYLKECDFRSPRLSLIGRQQPFFISNVYVTIWDLISHDKIQDINWLEFGGLIRKFHNVTKSIKYDIPKYNPFSKMYKRVESLSKLSSVKSSEIDCLKSWVIKLENRFKSNNDVFSMGVIHGDAHPGNTIVSNNDLYLIDYENISYGDQAWDLVPILVSKKRFNLSENDFTKFIEGYERDITEWSFIKDAVLIRELNMTLWLFQNADLDPKIRHELNTRMLNWENRTIDNSKWTKF